MAKIEIDYDVYQGLKNKIYALEGKIVEQMKEKDIFNNELDNLHSLLHDIKETGLFERIFKWDETLKKIEQLKIE